MSVKVYLDQPHATFTNLDIISGRVILRLSTDEAVSSIVVKLEGESKTRLLGPSNDRDNKKRTELEVHKVLYKTQVVFPSREIQERTSGSSGFTLKPGNHEYPFQFKIPFNNDCLHPQNPIGKMMFQGLQMEIARNADSHVKKTLPPTLSGFPGEAEIRYYIKVTVARPKFYQGNHRDTTDFIFSPIEPIRPQETKQETFAKRQHQFTAGLGGFPRKVGLFDSFRKKGQDPGSLPPPKFSADARLPNPAIITCNEPLPLRILVQKLAESSETLILNMLQIELIGYTNVRAHELNRTENGSWIIFSKSNIGMPVFNAGDPIGAEIPIDSRIWSTMPLPPSVAPSFETCNISRTYELEVRVGMSYGSSLANVKPEFAVLPLRLPVQVYSGIRPSEALLSAMANRTRKPVPRRKPTRVQYPPEKRPQNQSTPTTPLEPLFDDEMHPGPSGQLGPQDSSFGDDDIAPPSYEDAIADDLGPVAGERSHYAPADTSNVTQGARGNFSDMKTDPSRVFS